MYTVSKAIEDYSSELEAGKRWKSEGDTEVDENTFFVRIVTIDEYIDYFQTCLNHLKDMNERGITNAEDFNYYFN